MRSYVFVLALIGGLVACDWSLAARRGELIPETAARRHGLTRPWFTQVQLDSARAQIAHIVLQPRVLLDQSDQAGPRAILPDTLFVQTDQAVLHAIDAETGQTLWAKQVGRRGHPSFTPAANEYCVAVVNGSFLYVTNRQNGKLLWKTQLEGAPGAGAALSEHRVYVTMVDGLVMSYLLEPMKDPLEELGVIREQQQLSPQDEEALEIERRESIRLSQEYVRPLACQSFGRALVQPLVTRRTEEEEYVAWPTDRGFLFVGYISQIDNHFRVRYRLETEAGIAAQPAYAPPNPNILPDSGVIYATSRDGFVHAIAEKGGSSLWRFSTAEPIVEPPVVIGENVYAITQPGEMYCLDAKTGTEKWCTDNVEHFIASSKERVYVADRLNRILVLRAASGARLDHIPDYGLDIKFCNTQTDRIYLATPTGLVQCLHEIELPEPLRYAQPPPPIPEEPAVKEETPEQPAAKGEPAPGVDPFGGGGQPAPGGGQPAPGGGQPAPGGGQPAPGTGPFGGGQPAPGGGQPAPAADPFGGGGQPAPAGGNAAGGQADPFGGAGAGGAVDDDPFK